MAAPKGNNFNPKGRPGKPIDWDQFEQLCALQCTQAEIASMLKVHPNTLSDRVLSNYGEDYSTIYKKYAECGKCSLRRYQFLLAKKNASVAIWLGKIWLGQKDPALEDTKEDLKDALRQAVREVIAEPRIESSSRSILENKQSILDQKRGGEATEVLL